ncbi:MAG: V-type ATP synthase subunit E [Methanocella sp.]
MKRWQVMIVTDELTWIGKQGDDVAERTDLMRSMDEGVEEKKAEIRRKAEEAAKAIRCDARTRAAEMRKSRMDAAMLAAGDEHNRTLYSVKNEMNKEMSALKYRLFDRAFTGAGQSLRDFRGNKGYAGCYRQLLSEALSELGDGDPVVHIDPRDESLCRALLAALGLQCEVSPDLQTAGGLIASTSDGKVVVSNTIESRLEQAKDRLKLDVFTLLYGERQGD